jgi:hypothetical protein
LTPEKIIDGIWLSSPQYHCGRLTGVALVKDIIKYQDQDREAIFHILNSDKGVVHDCGSDAW